MKISFTLEGALISGVEYQNDFYFSAFLKEFEVNYLEF